MFIMALDPKLPSRIPVLNKIDLPASDTEKVRKQIEDVIGVDSPRGLYLVQGRQAIGAEEIFRGQ